MKRRSLDALHTRRAVLRGLAAAVPLLGLSACGFRLRGSTNLSFSTLYVAGAETSAFVIALKRQIAATTSTRIAPDAKSAQAVFTLLADTQTQTPQAYNADGTVAQYQLRYTVRFQLATPQGRMLIAPTDLTQTSNLSYNSSATLAKANESDLLYRGMREELINRLMYQLAAVKLAPAQKRPGDGSED
ncbi:MAG: LPS assembly lipoprotein LptE [Thiomonas sp.]|nr:LPS assembly lipoprotein LptE [Thiomonas sp.]